MSNICDEGEKAFLQDIVQFAIGANTLSREYLLTRHSELAKKLIPNSKLIIIIADGTYTHTIKKVRIICTNGSRTVYISTLTYENRSQFVFNHFQ